MQFLKLKIQNRIRTDVNNFFALGLSTQSKWWKQLFLLGGIAVDVKASIWYYRRKK